MTIHILHGASMWGELVDSNTTVLTEVITPTQPTVISSPCRLVAWTADGLLLGSVPFRRNPIPETLTLTLTLNPNP